MAFKSNILNSLQPQYREYYRYKRGGENLTFEQRRLLDAVRDNPQPGQLQALSAYLVGAGGNSKVAEDALYNAGVALGATRKRVGDFWQRLTQVDDYVESVDLENRPTEDYASNRPLQSSRVPGKPTQIIDGLKRYLTPDAQSYVNSLQQGRAGQLPEGLTAQQARALRDVIETNRADYETLNNLGLVYMDQIDFDRVESGQDTAGSRIEEAKRSILRLENTLTPYFDPSRPPRQDVVMLLPAEARKRGLAPATQEQVNQARAENSQDSTGNEITDAIERAARAYLLQQKDGISEDAYQAFVESQSKLYGADAPSGPGGPGGPGSEYVDQTELDAAIPEDWKDAAREAYPAYYAIVKNIPEIAQLLQDAINKGYTDAQFQAELEQTNWWKQTTASAREWDINGERDPATQQTQIDNRTAFIQQTSLDTFGVRISAETASELALDSLRQGWGQQFLLNSIGDVATQSTAGISQLRAGFIGQDIRQTAYDYGIAISENTFNKFVNEIAVGKETKDTFQQYALTQAKNLFPSVAERLDAGETFQQIVDPYKQNAAALLEIDPDSIDFTSPDWAKAITYQDAKGEQRPMNFTEFNDYVRQTRSFGYEYTDQAKNKAYKVASELANLFGRI